MKKLIINCITLCMSIFLVSTACLTVFAAEIAKDEIYPPFSINKVQQQIKEIKVENDIKFSDSNVEKD